MNMVLTEDKTYITDRMYLILHLQFYLYTYILILNHIANAFMLFEEDTFIADKSHQSNAETTFCFI